MGLYTVIVEDMAVYSMPRSPDGTLIKKPPARFPEKFRSLLNSPLRQEVHTGSQQVEIEIP